jgi:hypothetical protein
MTFRPLFGGWDTPEFGATFIDFLTPFGVIFEWHLSEFWVTFEWILSDIWVNFEWHLSDFEWCLSDFWSTFEWFLIDFWVNFWVIFEWILSDFLTSFWVIFEEIFRWFLGEILLDKGVLTGPKTPLWTFLWVYVSKKSSFMSQLAAFGLCIRHTKECASQKRFSRRGSGSTETQKPPLPKSPDPSRPGGVSRSPFSSESVPASPPRKPRPSLR